jgi:death-on-curing protein
LGADTAKRRKISILQGLQAHKAGPKREVRDTGLLAAAAARPAAAVLGADAYRGTYRKAAALMHSLAQNHALVDGNKRLCLAAGIVFLGINGPRLTYSNDQAYELVMEIAAGGLSDIDTLAKRLEEGTEPL